jgi:hypothetical protein
MADSRPSWWIPQDYQPLEDLDRPAFAWELLRRNPHYASERVAPPPAGAAIVAITGDEVIGAANWGLGFPGGPRARCNPGTPVLAP